MVDWSRPGCTGQGTGAVGHWGRSVYNRVTAENTILKTRALLEDQIQAGGIRYEMWTGEIEGTQCSCYKQSNKSADFRCGTCYGTSYVPGFIKFGYKTVWMSASDLDVALTNMEITTDFKSAKAGLVSGALTGTIESPDKAFSRLIVGSEWASNVTSFVRIAGMSTVVVEYSLDAGVTWAAIANLETENPTSGNIRFRATLTRDSTSVLTPFFEIVRARYRTIPFSHESSNDVPISSSIDDTTRYGPWVLVMRSIPNGQLTKQERGDSPAQSNTNAWMAGLGAYDPSIPLGDPREVLQIDRKYILEVMDGVHAGDRYRITSHSPSDPFARFVQQTVTLRYIDPEEGYALIW